MWDRAQSFPARQCLPPPPREVSKRKGAAHAPEVT